MINWFHIENFKSLVDFELPVLIDDHLPLPESELGAFTCLIGQNGAGKSTVLQALDFISHVFSGDIESWIERREWKKADLLSHFGKRSPVIPVKLYFTSASGFRMQWLASFNISRMKCTAEIVFLEVMDGDNLSLKQILFLRDGTLNYDGKVEGSNQRFDKVPFEFSGSVLSQLKLAEAHPALSELRDGLSNLCSLELLSPDKLRRKSRTAVDMGPGGERLASYLDQLSTGAREELLEKLREFYPGLSQWRVAKGKYGWRNLSIQESYPGSGAVDAAHINDGFLRVIAILAQAYGSHRFLLFDEIENGVHPSLVEKLMDFLVQLGRQGKQVVVTTHSPMVLNYLDDDVARAGVHLVYKTTEGHTRTCRYFEQEETRDKLGMLGPGEVFADTDLSSMVMRLSSTVAAPEKKDRD